MQATHDPSLGSDRWYGVPTYLAVHRAIPPLLILPLSIGLLCYALVWPSAGELSNFIDVVLKIDAILVALAAFSLYRGLPLWRAYRPSERGLEIRGLFISSCIPWTEIREIQGEPDSSRCLVLRNGRRIALHHRILGLEDLAASIRNALAGA